MFWLFCPVSPVLDRFSLVFPFPNNYPVLIILSCSVPVLALLIFLSYSTYSVLLVLFCLFGSGCPAVAVMFWFHCSFCPVTLLIWLSGSGFLVILFWLSWFLHRIRQCRISDIGKKFIPISDVMSDSPLFYPIPKVPKSRSVRYRSSRISD
jgi:hypothetical protein